MFYRFRQRPIPRSPRKLPEENDGGSMRFHVPSNDSCEFSVDAKLSDCREKSINDLGANSRSPDRNSSCLCKACKLKRVKPRAAHFESQSHGLTCQRRHIALATAPSDDLIVPIEIHKIAFVHA